MNCQRTKRVIRRKILGTISNDSKPKYGYGINRIKAITTRSVKVKGNWAGDVANNWSWKVTKWRPCGERGSTTKLRYDSDNKRKARLNLLPASRKEWEKPVSTGHRKGRAKTELKAVSCNLRCLTKELFEILRQRWKKIRFFSQAGPEVVVHYSYTYMLITAQNYDLAYILINFHKSQYWILDC